MKKLILILIILGALLPANTVYGASKIVYENEIFEFNSTSGEPYINTAGRLMVPIGRTFSLLGADVDWDETNKIEIISRNGTVIKIPVGGSRITNETTRTTVDAQSEIIKDRHFVALRPVVEALSGSLTVNPKSGSIEVKFDNQYEKTFEKLFNTDFNKVSSIEENRKLLEGYWKPDKGAFYATLIGPAEGQYVKDYRIYFGNKMTSNEVRYNYFGRDLRQCKTNNSGFVNYFNAGSESKVYVDGKEQETFEFQIMDKNHMRYKAKRTLSRYTDPKMQDYIADFVFIDKDTMAYRVHFEDYGEGIKILTSVTLFKRVPKFN